MDSNDDLDYMGTAGDDAPPATAMDELMAMVDCLREQRATVERIEEELAEAKEVERKLSEEVIPTMLDNHGVDSIGLANGVLLTIKEDVKATIPKDVARRKNALSWLYDHGAGGLIKDELTIEDAEIGIIDILDQKGVAYSREQNVNASSLAAWFREKFGIKKGAIASMEQSEVTSDINVYRYRKTEIKVK